MPELVFPCVSSRRLVSVVHLFAVALCAAAFLLPAQAAKKQAPGAKNANISIVSKHQSTKKPAAPTSRSVASQRGHASSVKVAKGGRNVVATLRKKGGKTVVAVQRRSVVRIPDALAPQSFGQMAGLHSTEDALDLKSGSALVIDQETREVLFSKNEHAVLPIASLTKLMTGLVVSEARLPTDEQITITQDDVDTEKHSRSRLTVGTTLPRGELLHLALMSSENRAAHALGRTYPGGMVTFVSVMNAKAAQLGMKNTRYVEPTGLSSQNQSSAQDLALLVNAASTDPTVRELTTSPGYQVEVGSRVLQYNNTNRLVKNPDWDIGVQKTGFINEAGQCLVMQTKIAGRKLIMVFLDSTGRFSRIADAERVRRWLEATHIMGAAQKLATARIVS